MTIAKGGDLQDAIVAALKDALEIPVFTKIPKDGQEKYCRVDSFSITPVRRYKGREEATHRFTVHIFQDNTSSLIWARNQLAAAHAAITSVSIPGMKATPEPEGSLVDLPPTADGMSDAHAWTRYFVTIGE